MTLKQAYQLTVVARKKELYDRKVHGEKFTVGELVWLCNPVKLRGNFCKLHSPLQYSKIYIRNCSQNLELMSFPEKDGCSY